MGKFLLLYRSSVEAREQMAGGSPGEAAAGMAAWQAWMETAGEAIVDFGAPVAGDSDVSGFSILEAPSREEIDTLLTDHPHRHAPGASIDVLEFLPVPGM